MTLEQRVEALEKQMNLLGKGSFVIQHGEVFFSDAFIQSNDENAAQKRAADEDLIHGVTNAIHSSELFSQLS